MSTNIASEWLKASKLDLENISYIIKVEHLTPVVAFHAQQSIEKSLKAIIESQNKKIPKQHDLLRLKSIVEGFLDDKYDDILDSLNQLYIDSRYPGEMGLLPNGQPTLLDAKEFYDFASFIYEESSKVLTLSF